MCQYTHLSCVMILGVICHAYQEIFHATYVIQNEEQSIQICLFLDIISSMYFLGDKLWPEDDRDEP